VETAEFGKLHVIFIRAPKINSTGAGVDVLANIEGEPILVVQKNATQVLLGATFHPELTTTRVHEYFLRQLTNTLT
jgi:5'-phosphate synthase pdxT subunit